MKALSALMVVVAALLGACRGQVSKDPPIVPIRNMHDQPKYLAQEASPFFSDGRTMRPLVEGTVAVEMPTDTRVVTGRTRDNASWVGETPEEVYASFGGREQTLTRGRERFGIYCAPCHGVAGDGNGMVSIRAAAGGVAFAATNLHQQTLRNAPDGQIYATITNGVRTMPAYRHSIPVNDRWAIVSYVRALQLTPLGPSAQAGEPGAAKEVGVQ